MLIYLFLFLSCISQRQPLKNVDAQSLVLVVSSEQDTFFLGHRMTVNAKLTNTSSNSISIPIHYTMTSNLFPNGTYADSVFQGGSFYLQMDSLSRFSSITIENLLYKKENQFLEIKPRSSINFKLDVGSHLNSFNQEIDRDSLKIKKGNYYLLQFIYSFTSKEANIFNGKVISNQIRQLVE